MKKFVEIIKMDYKIIISIEAETDISEAYCYYEKEKPGLGDRFLKTSSYLLLLCWRRKNNPCSYPKSFSF